MSDAGTSELEARIAALEAENTALRSAAVTARPVDGALQAVPSQEDAIDVAQCAHTEGAV